MRIGQKVIISLHDVMPESFRRIEEIIKYLRDHEVPPITLLVVPGRRWNHQKLKRLRKLADVGYEIAAHGWLHEIDRPRGFYHHLHAALFSRRVAEHLALDSEAIRDLMLRSHAWFGQNRLPPPKLYVPPAWALGKIRPEHLRELPFEQIEILRGLLDPQTGQILKLPLLGFEADTVWRQLAVTAWNRLQLARSRRSPGPVRISLHPEDFHLRLAPRLRRLIKQTYLYQSYAETRLGGSGEHSGHPA